MILLLNFDVHYVTQDLTIFALMVVQDIVMGVGFIITIAGNITLYVWVHSIIHPCVIQTIKTNKAYYLKYTISSGALSLLRAFGLSNVHIRSASSAPRLAMVCPS